MIIVQTVLHSLYSKRLIKILVSLIIYAFHKRASKCVCVTWISEFMCIDSIFICHVNNKQFRISCRKSMEYIKFKTTEWQSQSDVFAKKKKIKQCVVARMNSQSDDQRNQTRKMCLIWNRKLCAVYSFLRTGCNALYSNQKEKEFNGNLHYNKINGGNSISHFHRFDIVCSFSASDIIEFQDEMLWCFSLSSCANSECRSD